MVAGNDAHWHPGGMPALLAALAVLAAACTEPRPVDSFPTLAPTEATATTTTAVSPGTGPATTQPAPGDQPPASTPPPGPAGPFECTEVVGFSQTGQWFASFEEPGWQARIQPGASVEKWTHSDFDGWESAVRSRRCSRSEVDRVVFTISGEGRPAGAWAAEIEDVVEVIVERYAAVRAIVLQPVVGGPDGGECRYQDATVRASQNQPVIAEGIAIVVDKVDGMVVAGAFPEVVTCDQFADRLGHLTATGGRAAAADVAKWADSGS